MAADRTHEHIGLHLAHRYTLTEPLAQGALCAVYRGDDTVLRRPVAIKAVPAAWADTYRAALRSTATMAHPANVVLYDAVEHGSWLFLVEEYVPAYALTTYLRQGLPSERAVSLAVQIARALAYAHRHEMVHGDLTPAAVLIERRAVVRVNNFGLPPDRDYFEHVGRLLDVSRTLDDPTAEMTERETLDLSRMENSQRRRTPEAATEQGDIWALAALLWQLLTETRDVGLPALATLAKESRQFRRDVPQVVRGLVWRCLDGELGTVEAVAGELDALAEELARQRPPDAALTPPALRAAREVAAHAAAWSVNETLSGQRLWARSGIIKQPEFSGPTDPVIADIGATRTAEELAGVPRPPRLRLPSRPIPEPEVAEVATPLGEVGLPRWSTAMQQMNGGLTTPELPVAGGSRLSLTIVLLLGGVLFVIFFLLGYFGPLLWQTH